jgi:DNA invertase Pin-like site-specific DNA recombinase
MQGGCIIAKLKRKYRRVISDFNTPPWKVERLKLLFAEQTPVRQIAAELEIHWSTVYRIARKLKLIPE